MVRAGVYGLVLLVVALTVPAGATVHAPPPRTEAPPCRNGFFLVQGSHLTRFDERAARHLPVAHLPVHVDALAYIERDNRFYGIAGSRAVTVTTGGAVTFVGHLPHELPGARAAASRGPQWIVLAHGEIVTMRVPDLTVVSRVRLSRWIDVGDWDLNPADGMLYGLSSGWRPQLVRVDPATGSVAVSAVPRDLPPGGGFGAVAIDPHGTLHALHDAKDRLYHIPLRSPERASSSTVDLPGGRSDAASCPVASDFGDFPGGARHLVTTFGVLSIGASVGVDDGLPGTAGITASPELRVVVRNTTGLPALLAGWHDLNADGRFTTAERALAPVPPGATSVTLRWPRISVAAGIRTARVRLRLYGEIPADASPDGVASGGEIEDYVLPVRRPPVVPPPPRAPAPALPPLVVPPPVLPPPVASPSPAERQPAARRTPRGPVRPHLPVTLFLFAALLVPAITVAARSVARRGRPR